MVSIISKGADNLNSFRSIVPKRNDKSHSTTISTSFVKSENMDTNFVNVLNSKSFKSSIPSSSVLSLVKNYSSSINDKSTFNQLNLINNNNNRNNNNNICYNNNNVINMNNQQLPQRNDNMNHHTKLVNNQKKRYSCDQCSYSTDRRDLYRRHENIHRDEKPFRCYVCNKMFNRADHVKKHFLRIHKGLEYNVKLIKRINGVDYTASNGNHTTNGPPNTNNNSINNSNIASDSTLLNNNNMICDNNNNNSNNNHYNQP
ncbi:glycosyltransferase-like protein gnt13 [Tetranychus urticae]|uniref:glycosyltransferase-like protein gnt13 n=1 Tax=Tetranychus urticae TaxID=32264 RepID=UPI00077BD618|nr:glycosyltransferase-like protein gnt13 [Tetranychus urticae]